MKNEKGFTLIEMLIVLLVISVLLIITIPNLSAQTGTIRSKGCEALISTAEAQTEAYLIENETYPATIETLVTDGYLKQTDCPNGEVLKYDSTEEGKVISEQPSPPATP
ncbi:prepilin-type N-terminal cleavage/methylation domain-containing protein [Halobacillus litoralis]|uniref:competence type IV pilus major pilin ComGC n=1 Tax=Halobacillus litoralis TaxID=45668 RepID=UPI001CD28188|nr:competence type IV pilus major pilin ComGC [Halobacillus litoralis]MCA0970098.1 prepilin-type N-terminal cleavage/methylation domain-containing protein [Halobacillus litoralis]